MKGEKADVSAIERQAHWQNVYQTKGERDVSWFEESPAISLELIRATGVGLDASIVDIGGGASRLVDALVGEGFHSVTDAHSIGEVLGRSFKLIEARPYDHETPSGVIQRFQFSRFQRDDT
jgi:hypothetical protein